MAAGIKVNGVDLDDIFVPLESSATSDVEYKVNGVDISQRYEPSTGGDQLSFNTNLKHANVDLRYIFRAAEYIPPTSTPLPPTPTPVPSSPTYTPTPTPTFTPSPTPTPDPITCHWDGDGEATINHGDAANIRVWFDTGEAPFTVEWYDGSLTLLATHTGVDYPYDDYTAGVIGAGYYQYYAVVKNTYNSFGVNPSPHADFKLTVVAPTPTPEPTPTDTPEPTPTDTPEPTDTPVPTETPNLPVCYSIEITYDSNGQAAMSGLYCDGSDASFDTGEGAGTEGDVAFTGCVQNGYSTIYGGTNTIDYCS
jgi:hypothetical protein